MHTYTVFAKCTLDSDKNCYDTISSGEDKGTMCEFGGETVK